MVALKIGRSGNSLGLTLTKEALAMLPDVGFGDTVYLTRTSDGCRITPYDPEFEHQMKVARAVMKKRRNALRELARR
jgi:putative addiction module antidote